MGGGRGRGSPTREADLQKVVAVAVVTGVVIRVLVVRNFASPAFTPAQALGKGCRGKKCVPSPSDRHQEHAGTGNHGPLPLNSHFTHFPDSLARIYWSLTSLCHLKSSLQVFHAAAARLGFPAASLAPPGGGKGEVTVGSANPRPVKEGRPAGCGFGVHVSQNADGTSTTGF